MAGILRATEETISYSWQVSIEGEENSREQCSEVVIFLSGGPGALSLSLFVFKAKFIVLAYLALHSLLQKVYMGPNDLGPPRSPPFFSRGEGQNGKA